MVHISDVEHIETPDVSVSFVTVCIDGQKRRKAFVKTSNNFNQFLRAKIIEYCKNRRK